MARIRTAAAALGVAVLLGGPVAAQDTTSTSTPSTSTSSVPTTVPLPTETVPPPPATPLGPVQPLALAFDPAAGTIAIENPCATSEIAGFPSPQQVTYDLFLVPGQGGRVQLAEKQSPYATIDAFQTVVYEIPASLPHGPVEVLLQCSALPISIGHQRQQFSATIDWQGRAAAPNGSAATPAAPVAADPTFTG